MFGRNVIQRMLGGHDQVLAGSALYAVLGGRAERARPGGLGAALIGIAPAWGATPSLSVVAGQAGSAGLSVSGNPAPVITVEPADTLPSWVTGLSASAITWDASAPAGQAYSFRLRATNPFGSATSGVISGTVAAAPASSGFFEGYTLIRRPLVDIAGSGNTGVPWDGKQMRFGQHPDGRAFLFGGDWPTSTSGITSGSGVQDVYSLNSALWTGPGQSPGWKREFPYFPLDGYAYPVRTDCTQTSWDSKRRVFWLTGGAAPYAAQADRPPASIPVKNEVMTFDPYKPFGTQWSSTGVPYYFVGTQDSENYGPGFYDPVLDVVWGGYTATWSAEMQVWDCSAQAWRGAITFSIPELETGASSWKPSMVGFDAATRKAWIGNGQVNSATFRIVEVSLPSTVGELPAIGGPKVNWDSRTTVRWVNTTGVSPQQGRFIKRDFQNFYFFGRKGPIGNDANSPGADIGGAAIGVIGHAKANNGTYDGPTTGYLVNLDTGALEAATVPLGTTNDGTGWFLPGGIVHWNNVHSSLEYGVLTSDGYIYIGSRVEPEHNLLIYKKPTPSWRTDPSKAGTLFQWYAIPGSNCDTDLATNDRGAGIKAFWTGPEPAGRNCELTASRNPWSFSGMTLKRRDSVCLFHGGGNKDGRGNGILGFVLNAETPYWTMPMPPTPRTAVEDEFASPPPLTRGYNVRQSDNTTVSTFNGQQTPVATHAYTSCHYIESQSIWLRFGVEKTWPRDGTPLGASAAERYEVHGFDWRETQKPVGSRLWSLACRASIPTGLSGEGTYGMFQHPWTDDVIINTLGDAKRWKAATNTWDHLLSGEYGTAFYAADVFGIDPINNVALIPRRVGTDAPVTFDLDTKTHGAGSWVGDTAEWAGSGAKFTWDDDNKCLWALKAIDGVDSSFDLFKLTLENKATRQWRVTKVTTKEGSKPDFAGVRTGLSNRFRWVPELGGLVLSTEYSRPIWFISTAPRSY